MQNICHSHKKQKTHLRVFYIKTFFFHHKLQSTKLAIPCYSFFYHKYFFQNSGISEISDSLKLYLASQAGHFTQRPRPFFSKSFPSYEKIHLHDWQLCVCVHSLMIVAMIYSTFTSIVTVTILKSVPSAHSFASSSVLQNQTYSIPPALNGPLCSPIKYPSGYCRA